MHFNQTYLLDLAGDELGPATSGMTGRVVATSLRASTVKSPVVHLMKVGCRWLAAV